MCIKTIHVPESVYFTQTVIIFPKYDFKNNLSL